MRKRKITLWTVAALLCCLMLSAAACKKQTPPTLRIEPETLELKVGEVQTVELIAEHVDGLEIGWRSSDTAVAEVLDGRIRGVGGGTATVSAYVTFKDVEYAAEVVVTVTPYYGKEITDKVYYLGDEGLSVALEPETGLEYTVSVTDETGAAVENAVDADKKFSVTKAGSYTLTYSISGAGYAQTTVETKVLARIKTGYGILDSFQTTDTVKPTRTPEATFAFSDDVPTGADAGRRSLKAVNTYLSDEFRLVYTSTDILKELAAYDDADKITLTFKIETQDKDDDALRSCYATLFTDLNNNYQYNASVKCAVNEWTTYSVPVATVRQYAVGVGQLYFGMMYTGYNTENKVESVYLYQIEIEKTPQMTVLEGTACDFALPSTGIENFAYTYTVKNAEQQVVKSGDMSDTAFTPSQAGKYTVSYDVRGDHTLVTDLETKLSVYGKLPYGTLPVLNTSASVVTGMEGTTVEAGVENELNIADVGGNGLVKVAKQDNTAMSVNGNFDFILNADLSSYLSDEMRDDDAFKIRVYLELEDKTKSGNRWGEWYLFGSTGAQWVDGGKFTRRINCNAVDEYTVTAKQVREMKTKNAQYGGVYFGIRFNPANDPGAVAAVYYVDCKFVSAARALDTVNAAVDLKLPALNENITYTYAVKNGDETVASGTQADTAYTFTQAGAYTVEYTVSGGKLAAGTYSVDYSVLSKLPYGHLPVFNTADSIIAEPNIKEGEKGYTVTTFETPDEMLGIQNYEGDGFIKVTWKGVCNQMRLIPLIDLATLITDAMSNDDVFALRVYVATETVGSNHPWGEYYFLKSPVTNPGNGNQLGKGGIRPKHTGWTSCDITVGQIRAMSKANNDGSVYYMLSYNPTDSSNMSHALYIADLQYRKAETSTYVGQEVDLTLPTLAEGMTYTYSVKNSEGDEIANGTQADAAYTFTTAGVYTVEYTVSGGALKSGTYTATVRIKDKSVYGTVEDFSDPTRAGGQDGDIVATSFTDTEGTLDAAGMGKTYVKLTKEGNFTTGLSTNYFGLAVNFKSLVTDDMADGDYFLIRYYFSAYDKDGGDIAADRWTENFNLKGSLVWDWAAKLSAVRVKNNAWTEYKLTVKTIRDANAAGFWWGVRVDATNGGDYIDAVYFDKVEFVRNPLSTTVDAAVDVKLAAIGGQSPEYAYVVKDESGETVASGTQANTSVTVDTVGKYTVEYTISGAAYENSTYTVELNVTAAS